MTYYSFPKISFEQVCLPRSQGGVQLLEPQLQQHVLSLWWLVPVLQYPQSSPNNGSEQETLSTIVTEYIIHHLLSRNQTVTDHRILFVFPKVRKPSWKQLPELFETILYKAFDRVPVNYDDIQISHRLALQLPIITTLQPNEDCDFHDFTASCTLIHKLIASNLYIFNPLLQYLRHRFSKDGYLSSPRISS